MGCTKAKKAQPPAQAAGLPRRAKTPRLAPGAILLCDFVCFVILLCDCCELFSLCALVGQTPVFEVTQWHC
jgi:hypothetical protein